MAIPAYDTKQHAFVNVAHPVYAVMTDVDAETYGEVKAIAPAMSVKASSKTNTDTLYGDGSKTETATTMGETTLEFEVNFTSLETQAELLGHTFDSTKGEMIVKDTDSAPYVAVGFAVEKADGKHRCYWYYKGKFEEVDVDVQQREDKINFSTPTLSATFVSRRADSKVFQVMDEAEGSQTADTFLSAVPTTDTTTTTTTGA